MWERKVQPRLNLRAQQPSRDKNRTVGGFLTNRDGTARRVMPSGSIADLHNNGTLGQHRTILNAANAYKYLIFQEHRARGRWNRDAEVRRRAAEEWNSRDVRAESATAAPMLRVDVLGRPTTVLSKRQNILPVDRRDGETPPPGGLLSSADDSVSRCRSSCASSSASFSASRTPAADAYDHSRTHRQRHTSYGRGSSQFKSAVNLPAVMAARGVQTSSWPSSGIYGNRGGGVPSMAMEDDIDVEDDDAVSTVAANLARPAERGVIRRKLGQLEEEVSSTRAQRERLEGQMDEVTDLLLMVQREKVEAETRRLDEVERQRAVSAARRKQRSDFANHW